MNVVRLLRPVLLILCSAAYGGATAGEILDAAVEHHLAGRFEQALDAYQAEIRGGSLEPAEAARAHNNVCTILNGFGEYRRAEENCRQALELRQDLDDRRGKGRTLNNLGLSLLHLGELDVARDSFLEALEINRERADSQAQVINLANLGVVATEAGRYGTALERHDEARAIADRHDSEPWAREQAVIALVNQGVILERLGAFREALEMYEQALLGEQLLGSARAASLRVNLGVVYRNLGDPVRAVDTFESASQTFRHVNDVASLSNAMLNLALTYDLNLRQPELAGSSYREALELATRSGDRTEEIRGRVYLGHFLLGQNALDEAEEQFATALGAATEVGYGEGIWSSTAGLGRVAEARGHLQVAIAYLRDAMTGVENLGNSINRASLRSGYFGEKRPVYAAAIRVLAALDRSDPSERWPREALEVSQRAKARDLVDALGHSGRLRGPLDAGEILNRVGRGHLLDFFFGPDNIYRCSVGGGAIQLRNLGSSRRIRAHVNRVRARLASGREPDPEDLEALSRLLLSGTRSFPERLRIVPDGPLHYLPFEILQSEDGELLIDRSTVSYLPTASALRETGPHPSIQKRSLIGFGAPRLPSEGRTPLTLLASRMELPSLPAASRDLAAARRWLGGEAELMVGAKATEAAFREASSRGAQVLHLATHTVLEETEGGGAAIVLTPTDEDDGLLRPAEVAALEIRCPLTVLATCRSALGAVEDASALRSLTGAFLAGGSAAVVATLWDVGDEATAAFMEQFYFELSRGRSPARALRRAKQRLRADPSWNRADLWAGYVLVGDMPPLPSRRHGWGWWLLPAGVSTAVFLLLVRGVHQRRKERATSTGV